MCVYIYIYIHAEPLLREVARVFVRSNFLNYCGCLRALIIISSPAETAAVYIYARRAHCAQTLQSGCEACFWQVNETSCRCSGESAIFTLTFRALLPLKKKIHYVTFNFNLINRMDAAYRVHFYLGIK